MIRKERRKVRPSIPRSFEDLGPRLLNNYEITAAIYLGEIHGENNAIGYAFGSLELQSKLNGAIELYIDGTFAVSKFIFLLLAI